MSESRKSPGSELHFFLIIPTRPWAKKAGCSVGSSVVCRERTVERTGEAGEVPGRAGSLTAGETLGAEEQGADSRKRGKTETGRHVKKVPCRKRTSGLNQEKAIRESWWKHAVNVSALHRVSQ